MRRKARLVFLFLLFFLIISFQLKAQEKEKSIGIGISLSNIVGVFDDSLVIYLPIHTSSKFRLEPEIGFNLYSDSFGIWNNTSVSLSIGCGFFAVKNKGKFNIYYGVRNGFIINSYSTNGRSSRTDLFFSPALGGEYLFSKHFSLGGEAQISYILIGIGEGGENASELRTKPLFFLRWYF